ncbi:RNA polymerase sigma factor FliA [Porticoccus sp. W117]|uniref:RNA polymerase sigma factor FliA n=1 Tax=Porticoccus sp. W117 TaxID=3054777 RepID=UPI00259A35C1|nr:RNA polymerase sigma factor FliA [Porticoccus sp. W117]MDM3870972.1 RNA polymerase sigma factor FliA [Porticoccus sp. W117]
MSGAAAYTDHCKQQQEALLQQHLPLVRRIAHHLMARMPAEVDVNDLIQVGMMGLLEASKNYAASQGASFQTYASIRIRGAMLDELRRSDWTPRSVQRKARQLATATREVEGQHGRSASDTEVASHMGIGIDEYHSMLRDTAACRVTGFDDQPLGTDVAVDESSPLQQLQNTGFKESLADAIGQLPEREKLVMSLYYDEELNLREIGEVLGVSESRVCQIHSQALTRLRSRMGEWTQG